MATRNERRRKAKERAKAIADALAAQTGPRVEIWKPRHDVFDVPQAIRGHREPIERLGSVSKGKFLSKRTPEKEVKRSLVLNPLTGKLIERRKRYI